MRINEEAGDYEDAEVGQVWTRFEEEGAPCLGRKLVVIQGNGWVHVEILRKRRKYVWTCRPYGNVFGQCGVLGTSPCSLLAYFQSR